MQNKNNQKNKLPIFILGCQRSGTSLLRRIFDSHTNIACPPESGFIVQLAGVYENERSIQCLESMGFTKQQVLDEMRSFTTHFFYDYAARKGKNRWADKTPHYVNHAETIDNMFGGKVLYIGVVRHGLDVACSLCDYEWGILKPYMADGIDKPIAAVRFWRDQNLKLVEFKKKAEGRFHLIKYEDLTTDPETVLRKAFRYIDEPWEDSVLDFNSHQHDAGFEDPKITKLSKIESNSGNYKKWPAELQEKLFLEAQDVFEHYGYKI